MNYTITREDLVKLIESTNQPAVKEILINHLNVFDGSNPDCTACVLPVEVIEEEPANDEEE